MNKNEIPNILFELTTISKASERLFRSIEKLDDPLLMGKILVRLLKILSEIDGVCREFIKEDEITKLTEAIEVTKDMLNKKDTDKDDK